MIPTVASFVSIKLFRDFRCEISGMGNKVLLEQAVWEPMETTMQKQSLDKWAILPEIGGVVDLAPNRGENMIHLDHRLLQHRLAFSAMGFGIGNTTYVDKGGIKWGSRIDHILTRGRWHASRCWVGPDIGSDHRPVLADIYWE